MQNCQESEEEKEEDKRKLQRSIGSSRISVFGFVFIYQNVWNRWLLLTSFELHMALTRQYYSIRIVDWIIVVNWLWRFLRQ